MKSIMFIAPPAAGKGTQADILENKYKIPHISVGDIYREIAKEDSEIGNYVYEVMANGDLVKDEITYKLIEDRLKKDDCQKGFIIDGFPRNINQAEEFTKMLNKLGMTLNYVFALDMSLKDLEMRILGRRVCEDCKAVYNINNKNTSPKKESICDLCGGKLYQRKDDNLESFQTRYKNYLEKTKDVLDYYENLGLVYHIDGNLDTLEIAKELDNIISKRGVI